MRMEEQNEQYSSSRPKARTMLSSNIRSEKFQEKLQGLWTFAVLHAGEIHRREMLGEPRCKFEFGQIILSRVPQPLTKFHPRLHKVLFLGFAPNVTNGYWVMNKWDKIELTSNVTEDPEFDKADALMEPTPKEPEPEPPALHDHPYEDKGTGSGDGTRRRRRLVLGGKIGTNHWCLDNQMTLWKCYLRYNSQRSAKNSGMKKISNRRRFPRDFKKK